YGDLPGAGPCAHGPRHEARGDRRPGGVPCRPHAEALPGRSLVPVRGPDRGKALVAAPIDLYVFVERNVFDTDARWLDALALLALLEVPGLGLQVRTKTEPADRALELARKAREATRDSRSPVLLNGTTEEARALGYDGAHWPEALVPSSPPEPVEAHPPARPELVEPPPVRPEPVEGRGTPSPSEPPTTQGRARDFLLGASVHSVEAATRAEAAGAHFVVAGTVFDAGSKPVAGEGVEKLRRI